jgi:hypothetical protein
MNLLRGPLKKSLSTTLYYWVQSTMNFVIYPPNMLSNRKLTTQEVLLLTKFNCIIDLGFQFLGTASWYLPMFPTNLSLHPLFITHMSFYILFARKLSFLPI